MDENALSNIIIGAAIDVHKELGPGLLESAYHGAMAYELTLRNVLFEKEKPVYVYYKGVPLDVGYKLDFLVGGLVVVELKAVDRLHSIHEAQVITYLKLTGCKLGILLNFNVLLMKHGIQRVVYRL